MSRVGRHVPGRRPVDQCRSEQWFNRRPDAASRWHDGRFATLMDVVEHYNTTKQLALSDQDKRDLVEYLKSL
ncbi:hypothetical protein [Herbaspirillum sp. ST 5-3]|uniref:hypothetical protein n=1 Tax=Oxalobacteraceae TaxID=75682 RepID=UPI0010A486F3|nr:hypothetical protein [Herbaspirillum sp. ST 5-3]